tara:strand:- start:86 stop:247 length:162 start_codon:yes stop_codon:yes gene_type:complete
MPPHSFIKRDAGPIKEWWKSRIIMLIDTNNEDAAKSLYKEFHIDERPNLPQRY